MTTYRRRSVADMIAHPRPIAGGDGTLTKDQIDKIVSAHGTGMRKALEDSGVSGRSANRLPIYPSGGRVPNNDDSKSIGDAFIGSDGYRGWVERFPSGGPSGPGEYRSDPVEIPLSMQDASRPLKARSLFTLSDTSGGALSDTHIAGLLSGGLVRPPKLRDLLTVIPDTKRSGRVREGVVSGCRRRSRSGSDRHHRLDRPQA